VVEDVTGEPKIDQVTRPWPIEVTHGKQHEACSFSGYQKVIKKTRAISSEQRVWAKLKKLFSGRR
jgi:hypothetical protein